MLRKISTFATATALTLGSAFAASAEEHVVMMVGDAFFPEVTYAQPGDTVRFSNVSESTLWVRGMDGSWRSGDLAPGAEFIMTFDPLTKLSFKGDTDKRITGEVSFDPPAEIAAAD